MRRRQAPNKGITAEQKRIDRALGHLLRYGQIDGEHHQRWTIDQAVRILAGRDYARLIREHKAGEDGPATYGWDEGTPP